jgi:Carboxypeptidase regulatory-like domain
MLAGVIIVTVTCNAAALCVTEETKPVSARTRRLVAPNGSPVAGAEVTVYDSARHIIFTTKSNNNGQFTVKNLKAGTYRVRISALGFNSHTYKLKPSDSTSVDILRLPAPCDDIVGGIKATN